MRTVIAAAALAVLLTACGPRGGGSPSPYGGGAQTAAPTATPVSSPLPTGNVDYYGY